MSLVLTNYFAIMIIVVPDRIRAGAARPAFNLRFAKNTLPRNSSQRRTLFTPAGKKLAKVVIHYE